MCFSCPLKLTGYWNVQGLRNLLIFVEKFSGLKWLITHTKASEKENENFNVIKLYAFSSYSLTCKQLRKSRWFFAHIP